MSKVILYILLLVILFSGLLPVISPVYAVGNCATAESIVYTPSYFPENEPIALNFTIKDSNVVNGLKGKRVRLHFKAGDYSSDPVTITGDSFSIPLKHTHWWEYNPLSSGPHNAVLDYNRDGGENYHELCQDIHYQVGAGNSCTLGDLPSSVPPGSSTDVKFFGKVNTDYFLFMDQHSILLPVTSVGKEKTDNKGQSVFHDVKFNAQDGTKLTLIVCYSNSIGNCPQPISCRKDITVTFKAPNPAPPQPGLVLPPGARLGGDTSPVGQPTLGGGDQCDGGKGIKTAIGCIHTSPAEFAKDFINFAIGISGGLAFLMMLLGAFQMLTSNGNPDTLKAGQDRLTSAVIGLLFVIFAVLLLQIIGFDILRLPEFGR